MKRILIAFLSVFFANVALADNLLHINSNIVDEIFKKHIPPTKQFQALFEYNQIVKERGGITPDEIRRVCAAAGWQTDFAHAMTDGAKCDAFVEDLLKNASVKFYEVCGKDKSGGKCINDFQALTTNMIQATGLAKLYAYHKDKTEKVVCSNTARNETINNTSTIRGGMNAGMAPTTSTTTHYVQCKALDKNIFYEFKFNNTRGTSDSTNHRSFKTGICSVFGYKFQGATKKDNREKSGWDICDGATQNACGMINNALTKAHSGYFASWGPLGRTLSTGKHGKVNEAGAGYELSASQLPYCILTANAGIKYDGTAYERTAFGLDGRYFLSKDIQTQGTAELHEYIRKYVVSRGIQIREFSCAETYVTVKLAGRSDSDDMITCTINGSTVDFFFDDLSESKSTYIKGAKQALDCKVSGGKFTGQKCLGLGEEQCNAVRMANAASCPECKQIKWNPQTNICELPSSASAAKLKRGLNYTAIIGGTVVGLVVTVGTLGTATAPTVVVLGGAGLELTGMVIEVISQMSIDNKADKFFTESASCKSQKCAEKLIKDYLQELANQSDSLLDSELMTADDEFARLFELIPPESDFYTEIVKKGINGQTVETNKRGTFEKGSWNSDQIWRAVGIGLQIIPTVASVGWKIAKKSDKLVNSTAKLRTKLTIASKHVDDVLGIKQTKVIGMLDESLMTSVNMDDFIQDLEREGFHVEYTGNNKLGKKQYRILASADSDVDIEKMQMRLLKNASETDRDARLAAVGLVSDRAEPDKWYDTYETIATNYLLNDPDVEIAYKNWRNMSEWERYKFVNQTNRKIRHLITESPLPVEYRRIEGVGAAAYDTQRLGAQAKQFSEIDYDVYRFNPKEDDFATMIDNLVHENYHYSQDIGKTDIPKSVLDYNEDHYTTRGANTPLGGEYKYQPVERGPQRVGHSVSNALRTQFNNKRIEEFHEIGIRLQNRDEIQLKQMGNDLLDFLSSKTPNKYSKLYGDYINIKYDKTSTPEVLEYINLFDDNVWTDLKNIRNR